MHSAVPELISEALDQPPGAIPYLVSRRLGQIFPGHAILETDSWLFDLDEFAKEGHCTLAVSRAVHPRTSTDWDVAPVGTTARVLQGWRAVCWKGRLAEVLTMELPAGSCAEVRHWIVAATETLARELFDAVCAFNHEVRGEVLVYSNGHWHKDEALYRDLRGASFERLVLAPELAERLRADFPQWLGSRALYEQHGVPWKRGVLFLGPPGNGKSQSIKALVKQLGLPCLYVRSFAARHTTEHAAMSAVFSRARKMAPCMLVFEDLDALITDRNRSFFLNELDGFAQNTGLLTIATTNHPEKLDPAILERPSRFDRKYHFAPPALAERRRYLASWNRRLSSDMRMSERDVEQLAERTGGLSFAYLQELVLSSMMRWVSDGASGRLAAVAEAQVEALRAQMSARPDEKATPAVVDSEAGNDD